MYSLKKNIISGTSWTTLSTTIIAVAQIVRISILARFLDKSDFGIVAILTFITGFTCLFSDMGFSVAVMHKKNISRNEFNSIYWLQFALLLVVYLVVSSFSTFVANFYHEPQIKTLMPIALIELLLFGTGRLYETVKQKQMDFKFIAVRSIYATFISLIIAVLLAYYGCGIYSLVISSLSQSFINNLLNLITGQKEYKIQLRVSIHEVRPFIKMGLYQTGSQIMDYFSSKLDILILGKFFGSDILGIYSLAKELVLKIIFIINSIVNKISLPLLSGIQEDNARLRQYYILIIRALSFVNFPICIAMSIFSPYIVRILYGVDYANMVPLISILSFYALFICIGNPVGNLIIAKGRTDLVFKWTIIRILITSTIVLGSALFTIEVVALTQVILAILFLLITWKIIIYKLIMLSFPDYFKSFSRMFIISISVGGVTYLLLNQDIIGCTNPYWQMFFYLFIYVVLLLIVIRLFALKQLFTIVKYIKSN